MWWTSRPITNILSLRHQPKGEADDGSWWAHCWGLEGNKPPPRTPPGGTVEHWAYSLDPAYYQCNRIWVHPRRAIHDQPPSMAPPPLIQPSQPQLQQPEAQPEEKNHQCFHLSQQLSLNSLQPTSTSPKPGAILDQSQRKA